MMLIPGRKNILTIAGVLTLVTLCIAAKSPRVLKSVNHVSGDTILVEKVSTKRTYRISLYPDANQKVVFFSVRGLEGKVYQLYVFDVDGKLVKQSETRHKQTSVVRGIEKGMYFFEVFSDDTRIGKGSIAVK